MRARSCAFVHEFVCMCAYDRTFLPVCDRLCLGVRAFVRDCVREWIYVYRCMCE